MDERERTIIMSCIQQTSAVTRHDLGPVIPESRTYVPLYVIPLLTSILVPDALFLYCTYFHLLMTYGDPPGHPAVSTCIVDILLQTGGHVAMDVPAFLVIHLTHVWSTVRTLGWSCVMSGLNLNHLDYLLFG